MSDTTITTKAPKTSVITLHAGGTTMTLLAAKRADGSAVTTVTTKDGKTSARGMSETHESMEKAKEHLTALSVKAEKSGGPGRRRVRLPRNRTRSATFLSRRRGSDHARGTALV